VPVPNDHSVFATYSMLVVVVMPMARRLLASLGGCGRAERHTGFSSEDMRRCFKGLAPNELGPDVAIAAVLRCQCRLAFLLGQPLRSELFAKREISCRTEEQVSATRRLPASFASRPMSPRVYPDRISYRNASWEMDEDRREVPVFSMAVSGGGTGPPPQVA